MSALVCRSPKLLLMLLFLLLQFRCGAGGGGDDEWAVRRSASQKPESGPMREHANLRRPALGTHLVVRQKLNFVYSSDDDGANAANAAKAHASTRERSDRTLSCVHMLSQARNICLSDLCIPYMSQWWSKHLAFVQIGTLSVSVLAVGESLLLAALVRSAGRGTYYVVLSDLVSCRYRAPSWAVRCRRFMELLDSTCNTNLRQGRSTQYSTSSWT